jgi:hypothetical protein
MPSVLSSTEAPSNALTTPSFMNRTNVIGFRRPRIFANMFPTVHVCEISAPVFDGRMVEKKASNGILSTNYNHFFKLPIECNRNIWFRGANGLKHGLFESVKGHLCLASEVNGWRTHLSSRRL